MYRGNEAYDAELTAIAYGLLLLTRRGDEGQGFTLFTDCQAAMRRVTSDAPGPGQEIAIGTISLTQRLIDQGNITIRWTPAHPRSGGKRAGGSASERGGHPPPPPEGHHPSIQPRFSEERSSRAGYLAMTKGIGDRNAGRRAFRLPSATSRPSIRPGSDRPSKEWLQGSFSSLADMQ